MNMDSTWQQIVAILIVAGAVWVLVRRAVRLFWTSGAGGCGTGSCGSCAGGAPSTEQSALIQITPSEEGKRPD